MVRKKYLAILISLLLTTGTTFVIVETNDDTLVKASDPIPESGIGLDHEWIWDRIEGFAEVIYDAEYPYDIAKGRAWASEGENYTIDQILNPYMNGTNTDCGLTDCNSLTIGFVPDKVDPREGNPVEYSTMIQIGNYNLDIYKGIIPTLYKDLTLSEVFPFGIGVRPWSLKGRDSFDNARIREMLIDNFPFSGSCVQNYYTVQSEILNNFGDTYFGLVKYLERDDPVPDFKQQQNTIFILDEEPSCEQKITDLNGALGCILIENESRAYTFTDISTHAFNIGKVNGTDSNFSLMLDELKNGTTFFLDNYADAHTFYFSNMDDPQCLEPNGWVGLFDMQYPSQKETLGPIKDILGDRWTQIMAAQRFFDNNQLLQCRGFILINPGNTHEMQVTVHNWSWFRYTNILKPGGYQDKYCLPMFSVNATVGGWLREPGVVTVSGSISQAFRSQNDNNGVVSHNFVGYRNITQSPYSPDDKIAVLSHRIDGMWGETAGDSGTSGAVLMGIAKYMKDYDITPKYNLTFLFTTGEEYGMRGAQHFIDTHPKGTKDDQYNFVQWIGFDQICMNYSEQDEIKLKTGINVLGPSQEQNRRIIQELINQIDYKTRTSNYYEIDPNDYDFSGAEDYLWQDVCDTILFDKNSVWDGWHRTGANPETEEPYQEGDSLQYIDPNEVQVMSELAWNITKYYCVNPDCSFYGSISYNVIDSLHDEDEEADTIVASMSLNTVLPQDLVRVEAYLVRQGFSYETHKDYVISSTTSTHEIEITLPPGSPEGEYAFILGLYNSTGRINSILGILPNGPDDVWNANHTIYLHPRGNDPPIKPTVNGDDMLILGQVGHWTALTTDPNQDAMGQLWRMSYQLHGDEFDTGIFHGLIEQFEYAYLHTGNHEIRVEAYDEYNAISPMSDPFNVEVRQWVEIENPQQTHQKDWLHLVENEDYQFYGDQVGSETVDWEWHFGTRATSPDQNPIYAFPEIDEDEVITLNVEDPLSQVTSTTTMNVRVSQLDADFRFDCYQAGMPETPIHFTDTSRGVDTITEWTWDFDDGTILHDADVSHHFCKEGDYNVTLTVRDNLQRTDTDYAIIHITAHPRLPEIPSVQCPRIVLSGSNITILAEIIPTDRNLTSINITITSPNGTTQNYTMTHLLEDLYLYTLETIPHAGNYTYIIRATDSNNHTNTSTGTFTLLQPYITFEDPTPEHNDTLNQPWIHVNTSILDPNPTAAFIDWNHSLKGYWTMDQYNETYLYDSSPYLNVGTYQGGMSASNITTGKYGLGLALDANGGYIDLGNDTSLNLADGDFTFTTWINSTTTNYPSTTVILSNQPENNGWNGYILGINDDTPYISTMENGVNTTLTCTTPVTDNTWHHLAYVREDGTLTLYVDGIPDGTTTGSTQDITSEQHTCLNKETSPDLYQFSGILDEPTLFTRALTWDEINTTITSTTQPPNHNYTSLDDGTYTFQAYVIDTTGNQSTTEARQVTIDTHTPSITDITATPSPIGLGYTVTVEADVTDATSGINTVNAIITGPNYGDQLHLNETMTHTTGNTYQYTFTDTNKVGTYTYGIYAIDNATNSITQSSYTFDVEADASISISTLQDTYTDPDEYLNITDPPEIPEDYVLIGQGSTWNKYAAPDGDTTVLEASTGLINYQDPAGAWNPINQTIKQLDSSHPAYTYGYRNGNDQGLYSTYFKPNLQDTWPVAFAYNNSQNPTINTIRTKLVGVGYLDPESDWDYHILQTTQNSQAQTSDNTITYPGAFTGTDLILSYGTQELKEELIVSNITKAVLQTHPPSIYGLHDDSSYLVFITKIDTQNLALYSNSQQITGDVTIADNGLDLKDILGNLKCALPLGEAYEVNNDSIRHQLTLRVIHLNGETYILAGLQLADLSEMTYPVVIDPSITLYSSSNDGYIYCSNANYNTAWTSASGTVDSTSTSLKIGQMKAALLPPCTIYRGFLTFDTSEIPTNAIIDTATLGLYKAEDYSTTDFQITVQNGQPTYPHSPLQASDYSKSQYSGNGGAFDTSNLASGYNNLALNEDGINWINRAGWTKFCLRSSRDISGTTPTGNEYVSINSNDYPTGGHQPRLVIAYRNQSKIKNTGTTDIQGYLLMQVQFHDAYGAWIIDNEVINDTTPRTILAANQLGLDTIFNGLVQVSDLTHDDGTYRVYVAFRDQDGNALMIDASHKLEATWQFTVDTTT